MKKSKSGVLFVVGLLSVMGLFGCSQETPIEKTKAAAASGNADAVLQQQDRLGG